MRFPIDCVQQQCAYVSVYRPRGRRVAMEIVMLRLDGKLPVVFARQSLTRDGFRNTVTVNMSQQEECVRAVVEGCAERGVQVSDELASVFVSAVGRSTIVRNRSRIVFPWTRSAQTERVTVVLRPSQST